MIGKIEVLTPVEVVEKGDKTSKIKVSGRGFLKLPSPASKKHGRS